VHVLDHGVGDAVGVGDDLRGLVLAVRVKRGARGVGGTREAGVRRRGVVLEPGPGVRRELRHRGPGLGRDVIGAGPRRTRRASDPARELRDHLIERTGEVRRALIERAVELAGRALGLTRDLRGIVGEAGRGAVADLRRQLGVLVGGLAAATAAALLDLLSARAGALIEPRGLTGRVCVDLAAVVRDDLRGERMLLLAGLIDARDLRVLDAGEVGVRGAAAGFDGRRARWPCGRRSRRARR
jgi:hypothetical protein